MKKKKKLAEKIHRALLSQLQRPLISSLHAPPARRAAPRAAEPLMNQVNGRGTAVKEKDEEDFSSKAGGFASQHELAWMSAQRMYDRATQLFRLPEPSEAYPTPEPTNDDRACYSCAT